MTRRSRPLDVHGLFRTNIDGLHSLPEKSEEAGPPSAQSRYNERVSLHSRCSEGMSSNAASFPAIGGRYTNDIFSETSSIGTCENTVTGTGRSSPYSWANDDEFDRQASAEVRHMFAKIDNCLFENGKYTEETEDECLDWTTSFPYLRVLGKQLIPSDETGTQILKRPSSEKHTSSNANILEDLDDEGSNENLSLTIVGRKLEPVMLTADTLGFQENPGDTASIAHLKEEVFALDGEIEEFIAYDKNSTDNRDRRKSPETSRKKFGTIPPVTPDAFVHETSINECFDQIWVEVVHVLKRLLKLYVSARAKKELERQHAVLYSNMEGLLDSAIEFPHSRDDLSRISHLPSQMRLKDASNLNGLKELMTIRSVALQQRAPSVINNITRISSDDYAPPKDPNSRPGSGLLGSSRQFHKPIAFKGTEQQQIYDRMLSAKVTKRNSRLQPLQTPKNPAYEADTVGEVRGTRLQTGDRSSPIAVVSLSQQLWGARNGMLPPLERLDTSDTTISLKDKRGISPKRHSRASSALSNDSKSYASRERLKAHPNLPDSRPSTSQSYRDFSSHSKSILPHQGKLKDLNSSLPRPIFHQTINEKSNLYPFSNTFKSFDEDTQDFDDFILWGHGPPLISPQRRKAKSFGSNIR